MHIFATTPNTTIAKTNAPTTKPTHAIPRLSVLLCQLFVHCTEPIALFLTQYLNISSAGTLTASSH
ncbi:hypothetical protein E2C01_000361 [Portunus trituberculatus]|uniref:Uncharacterized protein n=1 Tax=Portunus trituberculatus TaxID=210409 RepID=A0A5B7CGE4_PORTR|nr:hypothetical protein [Portunus trituberculatus]